MWLNALLVSKNIKIKKEITVIKIINLTKLNLILTIFVFAKSFIFSFNLYKFIVNDNCAETSKTMNKINICAKNHCQNRILRSGIESLQGSFKNKEACPRSASEKPWTNLFFGRCPYIQGVKYIQFLTRNPIFRSKNSNSGNQGQKYGKTQFLKTQFLISQFLKLPCSFFIIILIVIIIISCLKGL